MGSLLFQTKKHCYLCGSTNTRIERGHIEHWYHNMGRDKPICKKCYNNLYSAPQFRDRNRERINAHDRERMKSKFLFFKKQIYSNFKQRSGYCSACPNNIYDSTCKVTHMHHWTYIIIFPWFGRVELCSSCHTKTKNIKQDPISGKFI